MQSSSSLRPAALHKPSGLKRHVSDSSEEKNRGSVSSSSASPSPLPKSDQKRKRRRRRDTTNDVNDRIAELENNLQTTEQELGAVKLRHMRDCQVLRTEVQTGKDIITKQEALITQLKINAAEKEQNFQTQVRLLHQQMQASDTEKANTLANLNQRMEQEISGLKDQEQKLKQFITYFSNVLSQHFSMYNYFYTNFMGALNNAMPDMVAPLIAQQTSQQVTQQSTQLTMHQLTQQSTQQVTPQISHPVIQQSTPPLAISYNFPPASPATRTNQSATYLVPTLFSPLPARLSQSAAATTSTLASNVTMRR